MRYLTHRYSVIALCAVLLAGLTGCGTSGDGGGYQYERDTVADSPTLGVSAGNTTVRGVVVYFHDAGANQYTLTSQIDQQKVTYALVDSGFAVISAEFGQDGFGDPAVVASYLHLGQVAATHYRTDRLYLLSTGMGAIPAIGALERLGASKPALGLVALNPILDLDAVPPRYAGAVSPTPTGPVSNPMLLPADALAGRNLAFSVDPRDTVSSAHVAAFTERFGATTNIGTLDCTLTGDGPCSLGDEVVKVFAAFEHGAA